MNIKKVIRCSIWLESNDEYTKSVKTSDIIHQSNDWLLYIPLRYISVRLDLRLIEQPVQLRINISLHIGCDLVTGEDSLFNREITKKHDMDNFLHRVMRHNKPTIQEAVIAQLLEDLQY